MRPQDEHSYYIFRNIQIIFTKTSIKTKNIANVLVKVGFSLLLGRLATPFSNVAPSNLAETMQTVDKTGEKRSL